MESFSGVFFVSFYIFSILSICWWIYLAYAHDGAGAYLYLTGQKSVSFLNLSIPAAIRKHFEFVSILVCFIIFLCALCHGFSYFFSWIPEKYQLTLGDGTTLQISTVISCLFGISASIIFGKWILIGICSYWENRALTEQSNHYFDIIRHSDNVEELNSLKTEVFQTIKALKKGHTFTPGIVYNRLELTIQIIERRIEDITTATDTCPAPGNKEQIIS